MVLEEFVAFVRVGRSMLRERLDIAAGAGRSVEKQYSAVSSPVFFQACGMSRGMNAQVPGPPTVTASPIIKVSSPSSTHATSSLSRCR